MKRFAIYTIFLSLMAFSSVVEISAQNNPVVVMETSLGPLTIELYPEQAPITVENFLAYVNDGFYEGTVFHRVIPDFMIQGGGFTPEMMQKSTRAEIENEAANGLKNERGTLAMARLNTPHSATAQFFINHGSNNTFLDHSGTSPQDFGYAVFGRVTGGLDVLDRMSAVSTGRQGPHENVPTEPIVIGSVVVQ